MAYVLVAIGDAALTRVLAFACDDTGAGRHGMLCLQNAATTNQEREPMNVRDDDLEKYRIFFEKERSEATKGDLLLISLPPLKHGRHNP